MVTPVRRGHFAHTKATYTLNTHSIVYPADIVLAIYILHGRDFYLAARKTATRRSDESAPLIAWQMDVDRFKVGETTILENCATAICTYCIYGG